MSLGFHLRTLTKDRKGMTSKLLKEILLYKYNLRRTLFSSSRMTSFNILWALVMIWWILKSTLTAKSRTRSFGKSGLRWQICLGTLWGLRSKHIRFTVCVVRLGHQRAKLYWAPSGNRSKSITKLSDRYRERNSVRFQTSIPLGPWWALSLFFLQTVACFHIKCYICKLYEYLRDWLESG